MKKIATMDEDILVKGSNALRVIDMDLIYPGVNIGIDFLHIHKQGPSEYYSIHAHPNFEFHYIAEGEGEVGFLENTMIDNNDVFQIPATIKSRISPEFSEYHLKHLRESENLRNTKIFKLKKGDAFMNPPGQFCWHSSSENDPIVEYGMRFSFSIKKTEKPVNKFFLKEYKIIHQLLSQNIIQITHQNDDLKKVFESIFEEAFYRLPGFISKIKNEILNLIILYARKNWNKKNIEYFIPEIGTTEKRLEMIDNFIQMNIGSQIKIELLAKYLFMSERTLSRFIKAHKGVSVHQYILQLRIKKAVDVIVNSKSTLAEVAYLTGFSSPYHLSKSIKNTTGRNPSEL